MWTDALRVVKEYLPHKVCKVKYGIENCISAGWYVDLKLHFQDKSGALFFTALFVIK